jgi:hypothetical protein
MAVTDHPRSSVDWQRVSARWKVIALAALTALVLVATVAIVALVAENAAKMAAFDKTNSALKQVRQLHLWRLRIQREEEARQLDQFRAGNPTRPAVEVTSPNYHNPPPAYVKGQILKIDPTDRTLVKVSLGSDAGVNRDNTLEVYRLQPAPEYLGRLLIRKVTPTEAVGRLMKSSIVRSPLMEGDEVASTTAR